MSKYFVCPEDGIGPGGDIIFRKHPSAPSHYGWYFVFVGKNKLGMIHKNRRGDWGALSHARESEFFKVRAMDGFSSRMNAATFIIKHNGYWMDNERERLAWESGASDN